VSVEAVSTTLIPEPYVPVQSPGQLIWFPVTVPVPFTVRVRSYVGPPLTLNVAETDLAELIVRVQGPVPAAVQSPPQPAKVEPTAGVGVRVTIAEPVGGSAA